MRRRSILSLILASVAALFLLAPQLRAQNELPTEIIERPLLTPDDTATVTAFVQERLPKLADRDSAVVKRNRDDLLSPFRRPRVSVDFRQKYTTAAMPELRRLAANESDVIVVNALRLAGEIATSDASVILAEKLADNRPAVRFAAVNGLERTMAALATRSPAMPAGTVENLVDKLAVIIADNKNSDFLVADAAERALISAMGVTIGNVRQKAFQKLSDSVTKLAQRFGNNPTPVQVQIILARAGQAARDELGAINNPLQGDNIRDAAALGGQLLTWALCELKGGNLKNPAAREEAAKIVRVAEQTITFACQRAGVAPQAPQKLADELLKGNNEGDNLFIRKLPDVILPLTADNGFKLPNNAFLRC